VSDLGAFGNRGPQVADLAVLTLARKFRDRADAPAALRGLFPSTVIQLQKRLHVPWQCEEFSIW